MFIGVKFVISGVLPRFVEMEDQVLDLRDTTSSSKLDPLGNYLATLKRQDVHQAIESLRSIYREVIILREFEDLSYQQIAGMLNCPIGTVMSRLRRAREKLKRMLEHWQEDGSSTIGAGANMNRCDECLSLIDFYLDDELRDDDLGVYKDQLDQCVSCRQELEERRLFLERVRSSRPLHVASGTFRNRLSQMLDQESWPNVEEIRPVISPSKRRP